MTREGYAGEAESGKREIQGIVTGKRRKDRNAWSDYFLSGNF